MHHCCLPVASLPIVDIPSNEEDVSEGEGESSWTTRKTNNLCYKKDNKIALGDDNKIALGGWTVEHPQFKGSSTAERRKIMDRNPLRDPV